MTPLREIGRSVGNSVLEGIGRVASRVQESRPVASDLLESDDSYLIVFDAPGAEAGDVQVRYRDGAVLVRIERFREHREGFEMRFPGRGLSLDGRVELPDDALVRPDRATAALRDNGTLAVEVPKRDRTVSDVDETVDEADRSDDVEVDEGTAPSDEPGDEPQSADVGDETVGDEDDDSAADESDDSSDI